MSDPGPKPSVPYCHPYVDPEGVRSEAANAQGVRSQSSGDKVNRQQILGGRDEQATSVASAECAIRGD